MEVQTVKTYTLDPYFIRLIKWVLLAASTDKNRKGLHGFWLKDGKIIASDGFRMHIADISGISEEVFPIPEGNWKVISSKKTSIMLESLDVKRPDALSIYTDFEKSTIKLNDVEIGSDAVIFRIMYNPKFLKDLADTGEKEAIFIMEVRPYPVFRIEIVDDDYPDVKRFATMMPLQIEPDKNFRERIHKGSALIVRSIIEPKPEAQPKTEDQQKAEEIALNRRLR